MTDQPAPTRRGPGRPVTTGTAPVRTLRAGEEWDRAAEIAAGRGETVPELVRRWLREYVQQHRPPAEAISREPAGRCEMCDKAIPATPDPRISRSRQNVVCSRHCEQRLRRQRMYERDEPVCEQREQHATRLDALLVAGTGTPYRCSWCRSWHVRPAGAEQ